MDRDGQRQGRYLGCPAKPAVRPRYLAAPLTAPTSSTPKSRATASEGSFDMVCCWHCHRSLTSSFAPWQICLQSPVIIRDLSSSPRSGTRCLMIPSCTHRKPALVRGHWSWCTEYLYCLFSPKQTGSAIQIQPGRTSHLSWPKLTPYSEPGAPVNYPWCTTLTTMASRYLLPWTAVPKVGRPGGVLLSFSARPGVGGTT